MPYTAPMLKGVDYKSFANDDEIYVDFSLTDLEVETASSLSDFLDELKQILLGEKMVQVHELVIAHLCAYLGAVTCVHTVKSSATLEKPIIEIIKHQANASALLFNKHPINDTIKNRDKKMGNLRILQSTAPGSIIHKTIKLGRNILDMLEELARNHKPYQEKQKELFCPQDTLVKLILLMSSKKCAEFREKATELNNCDLYMPNQMAIQIGWLSGYFSHMENKPPEDTNYFDYALPVFSLYREHVFNLMSSYAEGMLC